MHKDWQENTVLHICGLQSWYMITLLLRWCETMLKSMGSHIHQYLLFLEKMADDI